MPRPYALLRAGFPYLKTVGMRRNVNHPVDIALGKEGRIYCLCSMEISPNTGVATITSTTTSWGTSEAWAPRTASSSGRSPSSSTARRPW